MQNIWGMIEEFEEFKSEHIRYDSFIINSVKKIAST